MTESAPRTHGIAIDVSSWPLVLKRVGHDMDMDDMTRYLAELDGLMARREPFAAVVSVTARGGNFDRRTIGQYAAWVKKNREEMRRFYLGCAFVFPGEVFRFVLSGILLAAPAPVPHAVFGTQPEAEEWARTKLGRAR